jgi:hypothetical protein
VGARCGDGRQPTPGTLRRAPQVYECRAMVALPETNTMVAGDRNGSVKIFQWKAPPMVG